MKVMTDWMMAHAMAVADHHLVDAVRFTAFEMLRDARSTTMTAEQAAVYDEWMNDHNSKPPPFVVI